MRNQRSSQDDNRSFGRQSRMQERNFQDDEHEGSGYGRSGGNDPWRSQERDNEDRYGGSREQHWRGGGQSGPQSERDEYGASGGAGMSRSGMGGASSGMGGGNDRQQGQQDQRDRMFDMADRRAGEHDEDFHNWRNEHISKLDTDYQDWRSERRKKFAEEFEKWRTERNARQGASQSSSPSGGAQSGSGNEPTSKKS